MKKCNEKIDWQLNKKRDMYQRKQMEKSSKLYLVNETVEKTIGRKRNIFWCEEKRYTY